MPAIDDIIAAVPIDQVAARLGVDPATAAAAVRSAVPTLVGGLQANAADPAGASSLASALIDHQGNPGADGNVDLDQVDERDGQAIVGNIFGDKSDQVAHTLAGSSGASSDLIAKVLPILAPIVLAYVAKRFTGGGAATLGGQGPAGGLGDLLGGILGGSGGSAGAGGGIGGALGGLLGGGQSGQSGQTGQGGLGDLLGGLLGGGKR